ncbi:MAG: L-rhamnose/proton symporter RhaT [Terriglobia bacterium]
MSGHFWLGMAIIFVSGVLNGSFPAPMKYSRRWRWENTWLVFATVSLLLLPWIMAAGFVPGLAELYRGAAPRMLLYPLIFGFFWGVAQVTYGLGISIVGMALAVAVASGITCLGGSLVPLLVLNPVALLQPRGLLMLASLPVLVAGLAFYGVAGSRRQKEQAITTTPTNERGRTFLFGLGICIFTGIFGSNLNLGFVFGGELLRRSIESGANPLTATYAVWALVLGAGFIPNLLYCLYLIVRNRTWALFHQTGWLTEMFLGVAMALLWLGGLIGYGIGATLAGKYGTSLGFVLMIASIILASNMLGILTGEWKATSSRTKKLLLAGMAFIVASAIILNLGGLFPTA